MCIHVDEQKQQYGAHKFKELQSKFSHEKTENEEQKTEFMWTYKIGNIIV